MSTVKANDLMKVDGGIPTVKGQQLIPTAWVNFNGTSTVAIRDSENVSSITDIATGKWGVNFTDAMSNSNYASSHNVVPTVSNQGSDTFCLSSTASVEIRHFEDGTYRDSYFVQVSILGGQA